MKKLYIYVCCALGLLASACTNDTTTITGFEADASLIEALPSGGSYDIVIRSDKEWTAVTDVPWVMVSPANGRGEVRCTIKVDSTLINDPRQTIIHFSSMGSILKKIDVAQEGYAKQITPANKSINLSASAARTERSFSVELTTNVEFEVVADYGTTGGEWMVIDDYDLTLDRGARPRKTTLKVDWKMNTEPRSRVATLRLKSEGVELSSITINQAAAPLIEDNRQGDSLAIVTIYEKLGCWSNTAISTTESMRHWEGVRLWESTDRDLPAADAVGRVRDLDLSYFDTEDDVPMEIKYLKYLETLSLFGNVNTMLKSLHLCDEVCDLEYLKALRVSAFGLVSLPEDFAKLGDSLEELDLSSNNFNTIPEVIRKENFPRLRSLDLASNRRASVSDLRNAKSEEGIGIHLNTADNQTIKHLFLWEELEELSLSYNYIEGRLPDFEVGKESVRAYQMEDIAAHGDTLTWAVENSLPRILPNMRNLRINLNFFTGDLPDWLLYHPHLLEWGPEVLIYPQQEAAVDSNGQSVGFDNAPTSAEYYFEKYPLYRGRYEYNTETEE